jgi:hypothetical protein
MDEGYFLFDGRLLGIFNFECFILNNNMDNMEIFLSILPIFGFLNSPIF